MLAAVIQEGITHNVAHIRRERRARQGQGKASEGLNKEGGGHAQVKLMPR